MAVTRTVSTGAIATTQRFVLPAMKDALAEALLVRQQPVTHMGRQEADAGTGEDVVAPVVVVDDAQDARRGGESIGGGAIGVAILQTAELGAAEGLGGMARGKRPVVAAVGTGLADEMLGALAETRHDDESRSTGQNALADVVAMLHTGDKAQSGVGAEGNVLESVVDSRQGVALTAGIYEMVAYTSAAKGDGYRREDELARTEGRGATGRKSHAVLRSRHLKTFNAIDGAFRLRDTNA